MMIKAAMTIRTFMVDDLTKGMYFRTLFKSILCLHTDRPYPGINFIFLRLINSN